MIKPLHIGISADITSTGGLNRFVSELTNAQRANGINSSIYGKCNLETAHPFAITNFHNSNKNISFSLKNRSFVRGIISDYDILDFHFAYSSLQFLGLPIPSLVHFHGPWFLESKFMNDNIRKVYLKRAIESVVYKSNSTFITLSSAFADILMSEFRIKSRQIFVVQPGIHMPNIEIKPKDIESFRSRFGLESDEFLIIAVRRLVPRMGLEILIESINELSLPIKCLIIGEGPLYTSLRKKIDLLGLHDRIQLTGKLDEIDLQRAYKTANLSVIPSLTLEGFGLSALESMVHGTPVIASATGGLTEVMQGLPKDFLVEPNSVSDLSRALKYFYDSNHDFRQQFFDQTKLYDWKKAVLMTNQIYELAN